MKLFVLAWTYWAVFFIFPLWGSFEEILQEAQQSYQQGEKAETYEKRKLAFNRALFLYSTLEQEIIPPPASLNQALADTYLQLGEYPWAILYYQRALKQQPPNSFLLSHMEKAQQKLDLPNTPYKSPNPLASFFSALSQQFQGFFWIILITFLAFSLNIWLPRPGIRKFAVCCAILLCLFLGNFLFFYYFTPLEGILVKSTGFYRAPDWNQPQLTNQPLVAGSKVQILQMTSNEDWLKIVNTNGTIGYVPAVNVQPI